MFVDDIIGIILDHENSVRRLYASLLLAIDATCRPTNQINSLPRDDCLHLDKSFMEGAPAEVIPILGWKCGESQRILLWNGIDARKWERLWKTLTAD
jgi:hypothetical protein